MKIYTYAPDAVRKNKEHFQQLAIADGFVCSPDDIRDRPPQMFYYKSKGEDRNGKYSVYFWCEKDGHRWKVRCSDHLDNLNYQNDISIFITEDTENSAKVAEHFVELQKLFAYLPQDKERIAGIISDSDFVRDFIVKYRDYPTWFGALLKDYGIHSHIKNTEWFKIMLKDRCRELAAADATGILRDLFVKTGLHDWEVGETLTKF